MTTSSVTHEVRFVVKTGANKSVDVPIPVRVFCQPPDVVSYLFDVVSLTTDFRVWVTLGVRLGVRLRQL